MKEEKDWNQMKTNCQKIFKYLADHPLENITYQEAAEELNIPVTIIHYLIQSGKAEEVALEYGYDLKVKPKSKWNFAEVVYRGINKTQKERIITQEDNYTNTEEG